jgi:hypothetical protein
MSATPSASDLAERIVEIRYEVFGKGRTGLLTVASKLSLPERTWANYEAGVTMPATVMIQFIVATGASPDWLLTGIGDRFASTATFDRIIEDRFNQGE